jgi:hypothetical protein
VNVRTQAKFVRGSVADVAFRSEFAVGLAVVLSAGVATSGGPTNTANNALSDDFTTRVANAVTFVANDLGVVRFEVTDDEYERVMQFLRCSCMNRTWLIQLCVMLTPNTFPFIADFPAICGTSRRRTFAHAK